MSAFSQRHIVLGVCGGIAAYKAAGLASRLVQQGAEVQTVMTENATRFVSPLTFDSLTGRRTAVAMFDEHRPREHGHVELAQWAELVLVVPATANIIGKLWAGIADDLLSTVLLAARCPVLLCPAMNTNMWESPVLQRNIAELKKLGYAFVEPEEGYLACGMVGKGRLASEEAILAAAEQLLQPRA